MKNKKTYIFFALLSLVFLMLLSATAISLIFFFYSKRNTPTPPADQIYIYVTDNESEFQDSTSEYYRFVKEHNGQIGIFDAEGKLLKTIDTYVKTLPKADRDQLQEGIEIKSEKELYSIIEAYSD